VATDPLISVLLPVRDAEQSLEDCLSSLAEQTFTDWECLTVDDHSRDRTRAILEGWARRDPRFRVLAAPAPGGIVAALEEGRVAARGRLIARQDADDRSDPSRLARQADALRRDESLAVVGCLTRTPGALADGMRRYLDWLAGCIDPETCAREIWIESPIAHPTAMIRTSVLTQVGGYRDSGWPEDYDLWLRVHRAGERIGNVPEVLYEWTDRRDRLSRRDPRYAPEAFLRCRVHHLRRWLAERGLERPLVVWGAGRDGTRLARAWEIERRLAGPGGLEVAGGGKRADDPRPSVPEIAAFVDIDPRKIDRRRRGRPILDPESARRSHPGAFYLAAVGVPGARELIRSSLKAWGLAEGDDFLCLH
jgi:cellulose synthase/poly-beta-1,6-N-acetylglucosamine synthase-like glycosyltransferase